MVTKVTVVTMVTVVTKVTVVIKVTVVTKVTKVTHRRYKDEGKEEKATDNDDYDDNCSRESRTTVLLAIFAVLS